MSLFRTIWSNISSWITRVIEPNSALKLTFLHILLSFNKKTGKTCFILTYHPQIGSSLVRPDISKYEFKFWARVIHLLVSIFLKITGAKCCQEFFPDFMTVDDVDVIYSQHKDRQLRSHGVASQIRPIIEYGHLQSTTPDWWWEFPCHWSWETKGQPFPRVRESWLHAIFLSR